jgi:hypothetical protein
MVGARAKSAASPQPEKVSFRGFGSCMQGWYHRCIGLDPWATAESRMICSLFGSTTPTAEDFLSVASFPTPVSSPSPTKEPAILIWLVDWQPGDRFSLRPPPMAVAVPSTLPMKLRKAESRGKAPAGFGSGGRARVLVTVTVLGSAGPLRFLVDEGDTVAGLVRAALRCYAREGRMPLLGADPAGFLIYTANGRSDGTRRLFPFPVRSVSRIFVRFLGEVDLFWNFTLASCAALKADERISFNGCRSFLLWQKATREDAASEPLAKTTISSPVRKGGGGWKGLNKFLGFSFRCESQIHWLGQASFGIFTDNKTALVALSYSIGRPVHAVSERVW